MTRHPVLVVGAGHNGLVAACYLARAGLPVLVLEQSEHPGGGSRTEETVPGFRFDTHSVAHNMINMTSIPAELELGGAGLVYQEMAPFAAGFFPDGQVVRFHRSLDRTVAELAETDPAEARGYAGFIARADPLVDLAVAGVSGEADWAGLPRRVRSGWRALRRAGGSGALARDLVTPYGALLTRLLASDRTRAPVAAFAAHSSAGPHSGGTALFAFWQAAYHRFGQHHARGGAQGLTDALTARLSGFGGGLRCGTRVVRVDAGPPCAVVTADGERLAGEAVVLAIDPKMALLGLLSASIGAAREAELRAAHRGNAVQMLVHVATDALPAYPGARPGDWNGLQSHVDSLEWLTRGFLAAEARRLPDPPPTYAFTPSAIDPALAPPGRHTVYLACPCAPFEVDGGWDRHGDRFADAMIASIEAHAPGFTSTIVGRSVRTPALMAAELAWPGAHPMHLDISLDQLGFLRPTRGLSDHRTPVRGVYISGAGTGPVGGIAGTPGRAAARAVLADLGVAGRRRPGTGRRR